LAKKTVPNYVNIKIANTSPAALVTTKKTQITHIKDEIKFLYKKKEKLNHELYKIHLRTAQELGNGTLSTIPY